MRMQDVVVEDFPAQEYEFSESGVQAFCVNWHDLESVATMLNNDPKKLIGQVFKDNPLKAKALSLPTSTIVSKVKELAGGLVKAVASVIIDVLQRLSQWLQKS